MKRLKEIVSDEFARDLCCVLLLKYSTSLPFHSKTIICIDQDTSGKSISQNTWSSKSTTINKFFQIFVSKLSISSKFASIYLTIRTCMFPSNYARQKTNPAVCCVRPHPPTSTNIIFHLNFIKILSNFSSICGSKLNFDISRRIKA